MSPFGLPTENHGFRLPDSCKTRYNVGVSEGEKRAAQHHGRKLDLEKAALGRVPEKCFLVFGSYARDPITYVKYLDSGSNIASYSRPAKTSNYQPVCAIWNGMHKFDSCTLTRK